MLVYLKKEWKKNLLVFSLMLIVAGVQTVSALSMAWMFDVLVSGNFACFIQCIGFMLGIWCFFIIVNHLLTVYKEKVICAMTLAIRKDVMERLVHTAYADYHQKEAGEYVSLLSQDIQVIRDQAFTPFYSACQVIFTTVLAMICLIQYHVSLLAVAVMFAVLMIMIPRIRRVHAYTAGAMDDLTQANGTFLARVTDWLNSYDEFYTYNQLANWSQRVVTCCQDQNQAMILNTLKQSRIMHALSLVNLLSQLVIMLIAGWMIMADYLSIGSFSSISSFASTIANGLNNLSEYIVKIRSTQVIFAKMSAFKRTEDKGESIDQIASISMQDINVDYGRGLVFAKEPNIQIVQGGKYALTGESGCGKSTLFHILATHLNQYLGSVMINQIDLRRLSLTSLRDQMRLVTQKPYLWNTTLRDNITFGASINEQKLMKILRICDLETLIADLPQGLDTIVCENGSQFSGGQRQRIALARALCHEPKLLLLDEATSALDEQSAFMIEEALLQMDITIIMITHHLHPRIASKLTHVYRLTPLSIPE